MDNISSLVLGLEEQRNNLKKKVQELESIIQTRNEKISKLKLSLQVERFKSHLFYQLLKHNTEIKIDDILVENEEGIHIQNFPNGNIPIIVSDYIQDTKQQYSLTVKKTNNIGKNFRSVKKIDLVEEKPEVQEQKIKEVEEAIEEFVQENKLDVSYKEITEQIEILFNEINNGRNYKKNLQLIKENRIRLLGKLNINDYTKLIKTHVLRLEGIFVKKKFDNRKMISTITNSLSGLEQRLISYGQYYNSEIEADDIQKYKACLQLHMDYPSRYIPLVQSELCTKICSYSLCIFSLKEILKRVLTNPYGFSNIIYLENEKSKKDDPYSFYILEKIEADGKRCWKLECRLDDFSKFICEQIKTYCVNLFRKIYFDIFNDNTYREDYRDKTPATQQDCEQLVMNILTLAKQKAFCNLLRNIISKHANIQPSKMDKFNFTRDDPIVKKNFAQEEDSDNDYTTVVQRLFDQISTEDAQQFWQKYE
jgi:hypothetical protein